MGHAVRLGAVAYDPRTPGEGREPAALLKALLRLKPSQPKDIEAFCSSWGLLGLLGSGFQEALFLRAGEPAHLARSLALEAAHTSTVGPSAQRRTAQLFAVAEETARQGGEPYGLASVTLARCS